MAGINLLPWRAERRKQKQKEFFAVTATALLSTAAILAFVHFRIAGMIEYQGKRNEYLQSEVNLLDKKLTEIEELEKKKKNLIARMEVIQQLQSSRPEIVHLFDELARTVPEGVQLIDLSQADRSLTINGIAQSNARVSAYMRNLASSAWLKEPRLDVIETKPDTRDKDKKEQRGSRFTLQVKQGTDDKKAQDKTPS
jgi:type IV pilus assembly protein PilN